MRTRTPTTDVQIPYLGDVQLLKAVMSNDPGAWRRFEDRFRRSIVNVVRSVARSYGTGLAQADVEDLLGNIWLMLLSDDKRRLRRFDPQRGVHLSIYVGQIARNHTIDFLRRRRREWRFKCDTGRSLWARSQRQRTPQDAMEQRETWGRVWRALTQLEGHERQVLLSDLRDGPSGVELARQLGITVGTLYARRFKLRRRIARSLAE